MNRGLTTANVIAYAGLASGIVFSIIGGMVAYVGQVVLPINTAVAQNTVDTSDNKKDVAVLKEATTNIDRRLGNIETKLDQILKIR